jgi:predicted ATPase
MITKIEVNGFKSLSDFDLKLNAGLNILVGPNGSGKTNIILFFEFLSQLMSNQIGHAVSAVGGAGTIFKKIGLNDYEKDIEFKIYGSKKLQKRKTVTYEYAAKITTSFEKDSIIYSRQSIKLRSGSKFWKDPDEKGYSRPKWDIDISFQQVEGKANVEINTLNTKKIESRFLRREKQENDKMSDEISNFIKESLPSVKSIVNSLFPIADDLAFSIYADLIGGETFNVVPSKVKEQEDAATPPGIKKDGSGLATTLYAMKNSKSKEPNFMRFHFYFDHRERTYDPNTLKKIVSYLKLANRTIKDLDVVNDPFNNKLVVKVFIETGEYTSVLPLSAMSDGTIKWLALITAILTSKTIFSIEEPENFLHPWMQAEIANIMREHIENKELESFVLMTTHSESLLNHSEPNEILLVDLDNGKTTAKRLNDISLIQDEISKSGFGLGHFYFSNALHNE